MEILFGILWVAGVVYAAKQGVRAAANGYRKSRASAAKKAPKGELSAAGKRRHAVAWWTREAGQGFPVTRAGFQRGWLAHQTAMAQHHAQREEARTSHLEARASVLSELAAHRKRQAEAQKRIDQATAPPEEKPRPERPAATVTPLPQRRICAACGNDETPDDPLVRDEDGWNVHRSHIQQKGKPMTSDPGWITDVGVTGPQPGAPVTSIRQGGTQPMTTRHGGGGGDVNYTQALTQAKQVAQEADDAVHDIRWQQMANTVDQLGSLLSGDSASLSDANDVAEALRAQRKAMEQTRDAAETFARNLQARHGGIKEAVDDAPVPMGERPFYED